MLICSIEKSLLDMVRLGCTDVNAFVIGGLAGEKETYASGLKHLALL